MNENRLHGFRVLSSGPVPASFKRALRDLAARGFLDASCTIVKTSAGARSGITHAGGRYLHARNASAPSVLATMREQGIEPPPLPFLVAPGPTILFHEWGHHVDRVWSGADPDAIFSLRWFSAFYELRHRGEPIGTKTAAADVLVAWWRFSSELFASLFEDWMRDDKRVPWDECDPALVNRGIGTGEAPLATIHVRPGSGLDDVRERTYALFEQGLGSAPTATVRADLLGEHTDEIVAALSAAFEQLRADTAG